MLGNVLSGMQRAAFSLVYTPGLAMRRMASVVGHKLLDDQLISVEDVIQDGSDAISNGGAFQDITSNVDDIGGGAYHIVYRSFIYFALICIIIIAGGLLIANSGERSEKKTKLVWAIVGVVLGFGAIALITFLSKTAGSLWGSVGGN